MRRRVLAGVGVSVCVRVRGGEAKRERRGKHHNLRLADIHSQPFPYSILCQAVKNCLHITGPVG